MKDRAKFKGFESQEVKAREKIKDKVVTLEVNS